MPDNRYSLAFELGADRFMEHLKKDLQEVDVSLSKVSMPQSLVSFRLQDKANIQLRLVMLSQPEGRVLGRLSWLDASGQDYVCCFVDEEFKKVSFDAALSNESLKPDSIRDLCMKRLEEVTNALH